MYVLVVAISGGDVVATSVVAKSAPSLIPLLVFPPFSPLLFSPLTDIIYPPEVLEAN